MANNAPAVAVLVVEDDDDIRETLHIILEDAEYSVFDAPDGISALDRVRASSVPLVVLLDWWMPGIDGLQILHLLAEDARLARRHAYILLTAAYDAPGLDFDALPNELSVSIMHKPFDLDHMLHDVEQAASALSPDR